VTQKSPAGVVSHILRDILPLHPGLLERCCKYISLSSPIHITIKSNSIRLESTHIVREEPPTRFPGATTPSCHPLFPGLQLLRLEDFHHRSLVKGASTISRRGADRFERGLRWAQPALGVGNKGGDTPRKGGAYDALASLLERRLLTAATNGHYLAESKGTVMGFSMRSEILVFANCFSLSS